MKIKIFVALLVSFNSYAFTIGTGSEQRGLESLMLGAGQARIGSYGSLAGNSSLMAWSKGEQKFITTNLFYYTDNHDSHASIDPKFVPNLAASVEKWGDIFVSYGLIGDSDRYEINAKIEDSNDYRGINTSYSGVIAFAHKLNPNLALGLNLSIDYFSSELSGGGNGINGVNRVYSYSSSEAAITSQVGLNFSYKLSDWVVGGSFKTPFIKYWSEGKQKIRMYDENLPQVLVQESNTKPSIVFERETRIGIRRKISESKVYLDLSYIPQYTDEEADVTEDAKYKINFAQEFRILERLNFYYGIEHGEDFYQGMVGFSKGNQHSRTFYGLGFGQDRENSYKIFQLAMGTFFDY